MGAFKVIKAVSGHIGSGIGYAASSIGNAASGIGSGVNSAFGYVSRKITGSGPSKEALTQLAEQKTTIAKNLSANMDLITDPAQRRFAEEAASRAMVEAAQLSIRSETAKFAAAPGSKVSSPLMTRFTGLMMALGSGASVYNGIVNDGDYNPWHIARNGAVGAALGYGVVKVVPGLCINGLSTRPFATAATCALGVGIAYNATIGPHIDVLQELETGGPNGEGGDYIGTASKFIKQAVLPPFKAMAGRYDEPSSGAATRPPAASRGGTGAQQTPAPE